MNKTINYLKSLLREDDTVILSCSAGPDSMCLYNILLKLKKEINFNIVCVHINHTRRKASDKEESFLENYSIQNKVTFESKTITEFNDNFQQDARDKRHAFLNTVKDKYKGTYILTAHHGDDLIETILMRITRGSNLSGYAGFKIKNGVYIKPLIFYTKEDILKYNKQNKIPYKVDKSNKSKKYTRNRYRLKILKELKKEYKDINRKYMTFSQELLKYDEYVNNLVKNKNIINDKKIDLKLLNKEDDFIKERVLELFILEYQKENLLNVSNNVLKELIKVINSNKKNINIDLPNGFKAIKKDNLLYLKKEV